jgi:hypothetical protein
MEHKNSKTTNTKTPSNILLKLTSLGKLKFLTMEERGVLLTNAYHFHTGDELIEMTPITEMLFMDLAEVFEYNIEKYQTIVERNRENGKKGGSKKKEPKTQNNPLGLIGNPNEAKDIVKAIEKVKEKDEAKAVVNLKAPVEIKAVVNEKVLVKEEDRGKENEIDIHEENPVDIQLNRSLFDIKTKSYNSIEKIKAIVKLDISPIYDYETSRFIKNCKNLVNSSGWEGFYQIILNSEVTEIPVLLNNYKPELSKETILDMRTNLVFYLSKFNKILN